MSVGAAVTLRWMLRLVAIVTVVGLVLYLWLAKPIDLQELWRTLRGLPPGLWPVLVTLGLACYGFRFVRWLGFVKTLGGEVPFWRHLVIYQAGFAPGVPLGKAGELVRCAYLRPYGVPLRSGAVAVFADRLLDLVSVGVLSCLALGLLTRQGAWAWSALAFCAAAVLVLRSPLLLWLVRRLPRGRWTGEVDQALQGLRSLLTGSRLWWALLWSVLAWAAQGLCLYATLRVVGHDVVVHHVLGIYALGILAGAATFIPGGMGAAEAAIVWALGFEGVPPAVALAAALVGRGVPQWLGLGLSLLAMARLGMVSGPPAVASSREA